MKIKRIITAIFFLIIVLFSLSFAILNASPVAIHYYLGTTETPLSLLLVYAFGLGILLTLCVTALSLFQLKIENRSLKKMLEKNNALQAASSVTMMKP